MPSGLGLSCRVAAPLWPLRQSALSPVLITLRLMGLLLAHVWLSSGLMRHSAVRLTVVIIVQGYCEVWRRVIDLVESGRQVAAVVAELGIDGQSICTRPTHAAATRASMPRPSGLLVTPALIRTQADARTPPPHPIAPGLTPQCPASSRCPVHPQ